VRESREHPRLPCAHLSRRSAKVERGARLYAYCALPELDAIEILLEHLLPREMRAEPERPERLDHLAADGARRGVQQSRGLHRDGRSAGDDASRARVVPGRARDSAPIDGAVREETPVLHRDEGRDEFRVDVGDRDPARTAAIGGARGAEHDAVAIGERERGLRDRSRECARERPRDERRDRECACTRYGNGCHSDAPYRHGARHQCVPFVASGVTVNTPPSLRPLTDGLYISSACAGGRMNTPGVVARAM